MMMMMDTWLARSGCRDLGRNLEPIDLFQLIIVPYWLILLNATTKVWKLLIFSTKGLI